MTEIVPITMPKLGLTVEEGTVVQWHKAEGALVQEGEELFDVETSKITTACESPARGYLRRRLAREGDVLPIGALVAVLAETSVPESSIESFVAGFATIASGAEQAEAAPVPQTMTLARGALRYLEIGTGDGVPVLLLHGFGGDLENWLFVQPKLATRRRTIALDLPGHGGSTKNVGNGTFRELAGAVLDFLDGVGLETVHLVGHSMGGAVCLETVALRPQRIRSVTLISPAGLGPEIAMGYIEGYLAATRPKQLRPVLEMLFADPTLVGRDMIDGVLKNKRLDGATEALLAIAAAAFRDGRQMRTYGDLLDAAPVPVQVVWGEEDRIIPSAQSDQLPAGVPLRRIEGAGHMAHLERPDLVVETIERIISA